VTGVVGPVPIPTGAGSGPPVVTGALNVPTTIVVQGVVSPPALPPMPPAGSQGPFLAGVGALLPRLAGPASVPNAVAQIVSLPGPTTTVLAGGGDPASTVSLSAQLPASPGAGNAKVAGSKPDVRGVSEQQARIASALSAGLLEFSRTGSIVLQGEILALNPSSNSLAAARRLGFAVVEKMPLKGLGLDAVILRAPPGVSVDEALGRLQAADPEGGYSLNPIYATTGQIGAPARSAPAAAAPGTAPSERGSAVGLIDTGVFVQHPALAGARLEQQGFAPGGLTPAKHGTAVASIAAGQAGDFHGVAPGSRIYVADVYGKTGAGGSASAVAEGIDWLVLKGAPVINISLVGPPNRLMEAAVEAAIRKGVIVVAAVGNDGPSSPPLYPAAYRGVLAVTGVDQNDHILLEAVRATQVAFAAPGADIFAADGAAGFAKVRGTSFAAPIVAGQLALSHRRLDGKDATAAIQGLKQAARSPAADGPAYGFGIVGETARGALRPGLSQLTTAQTDAERSKE
jgi:hypothetical protein